MKSINVQFPDEERFEELRKIKGGRNWREAIYEEFGVAEPGERDA